MAGGGGGEQSILLPYIIYFVSSVPFHQEIIHLFYILSNVSFHYKTF